MTKSFAAEIKWTVNTHSTTHLTQIFWEMPLEKPQSENQSQKRIFIKNQLQRNFWMLQQYRTALNTLWKLCPLHRNLSPLLYCLPATVWPVICPANCPNTSICVPRKLHSAVWSISVLHRQQLMLQLFCSMAQKWITKYGMCFLSQSILIFVPRMEIAAWFWCQCPPLLHLLQPMLHWLWEHGHGGNSSWDCYSAPPIFQGMTGWWRNIYIHTPTPTYTHRILQVRIHHKHL